MGASEPSQTASRPIFVNDSMEDEGEDEGMDKNVETARARFQDKREN